MGKLQGFRLVGVHANQNTIVYPDTIFQLDGKNTLIDMMNGGGKTLAVQMLFQTILPNSYFNEKNQVANLFAGVAMGATIHTVSQFKMEGEGFQQLVLGFAATVEPSYQEAALESLEDAAVRIKYMNYIVAGNDLAAEKLTLTTLPLSKDHQDQKTAIGYKELKSYLRTKTNDEKHQQRYVIELFENEKNRYYQQLRKYGINAEVFEFLREINRDENYIRLFFEEHCRRPRDLLMNFIVPNTEKALNAKMFMAQLDNVDPTAQLADSLFEKSQSITQLNDFHKDIAAYQMIQEEMGAFQAFVESKEAGLKGYEAHLQQYPQQVARYTKEAAQCETEMLSYEGALAESNDTLATVETQLTFLHIRELQIKQQQCAQQLQQKQEKLLAQQAQIQQLETERTRLEAINLIIDYKENEAEKNAIEEKLEKLTAVHYDEKRVTAGFANTICAIGTTVLQQLATEGGALEADNLNDRQAMALLQQEAGMIALQKKQHQNQMQETEKDKGAWANTYKEILQQWQGFPALESTTDEAQQEELNQKATQTTEAVAQIMAALEAEKAQQQNETTAIEKGAITLLERQRQLQEKQQWFAEYETSLSTVRKMVQVNGEDLQHNYAQLKEEIETHARKTVEERKKAETLEEEIQVLQDYGFLRRREKYDALHLLQEDWQYAKFGSDILRELEETQVHAILEKFPGFAEVLVVSDADYNKVVDGKHPVAKAVAKENFVLMPWSAIAQLSGEMSFGALYLLTRNGDYYQGLLNPKEAIAQRQKQLEKSAQKLALLQEEKSQMQEQLERLAEHLHRYPEVLVTQCLFQIDKLQQEIKEIEAQQVQREHQCYLHQNTIDRLVDQGKHQQTQQAQWAEMQQVLAEKIRGREKICTLETLLETLQAEAHRLGQQQEDNKAAVHLTEKNILQRDKTMERLRHNQNQYASYMAQAEGYQDATVPLLNETDITNLFRRFEVAKRKFDIEAQSYEELMARDQRLNKLLEEIQKDYRFQQFDFGVLYEEKAIEKTEAGEFYTLQNRITQMLSIKDTLDGEKNEGEAQWQMAKKEFEQVAHKITVAFVPYESLSGAALEAQKREQQEIFENITQQIAIKTQQLKDKTQQCQAQQHQAQVYQMFCDSHKLDWKNAVPAETKIPYAQLYQQFEGVKQNYERTISRINVEIKRLDALCEKLSIGVQFKGKLRDAFSNKRDYAEVLNLVAILEKTADEMTGTIGNLQVSIANIGRLDEEIAAQVFRLLKTILDEICKIPAYSKFKYEDYTRESFRMNLTDENGARIESEIAFNNIKTYVYDLAFRIQKENLSKRDIKNQLSIYHLIPFGIDLQKLTIQILKIDQNHPRYYHWDRLSASSGQGYVTYVMFAITMIKYFNSVTALNDRMIAPIFLFLDNPFGSASNIQLWEPVRRFLDKSNAQLLCVAHNVPPAGQILFDKHILMEQVKNERGQLINLIRNEKVESKTIIQKKLLEHPTIDTNSNLING